MVKVSTLIHRVDGFDEKAASDETREPSDQNIDTQFLADLLEPLMFDPGEKIVQKILHNV
jgi:hypothetical protein